MIVINHFCFAYRKHFYLSKNAVAIIVAFVCYLDGFYYWNCDKHQCLLHQNLNLKL